MPHGVHTPSAPGWTQSIEFAGRCLIVASLALIFLFTLGPMTDEFKKLQAVGVVGLVVLGLIQITIYVLILTRRNTMVMDMIVVVATTGALVLILLGQPAGPWESRWWPASAVHAVQLYVLAFGRRHQWVLGGAAVVAFAGLRLVATIHSEDRLGLGLAEVVLGVQLSLTVTMAVLACRRMAGRHDRAEAERAGALAAQCAQEHEERRGREINRFLHDEVIHSLRAIALPRDRVSAEQARDGASRTATRLRAEEPSQRWSASVGEVGVRLGEVGKELGLQVSVNGRLAGVPDDVLEAFERAGSEVLRNVARHAGTDRVRIRLTNRRGRVTVLIADDGFGFDTTRLGSGLRDSVFRRMAEVGGRAVVDSGPGGTTVELSRGLVSSEEQVDRAWAELSRALTPIVWPGTIGLLLMGLLLLPEIANWPLLLIGLAVVSSVAVLALRWPARRLPPAGLPVLVGAAVIGVLTNYLAVPRTTQNGYHLLMAGGVSYLVILMAIHYSTRWAVLGAVVVWGSVVGLGAWRFSPEAMVGPLAGASTGPAFGSSVVLLKGVLRRVAKGTIAAQEATIHSQLSTTDSAQRSFDDDQRLRRTRDRILPFLAAVAEGRLDPGDPATAARATGLEAAVREELRWRSTPQAVARAADRARALGWQLELRLTEEEVARNAEPLVGLLEALGRPAGSGTAVMSAFGGLTVVVQAPSPEALERWRGRDDLWLRESEEWCRLLAQVPELVEVPQPGEVPERDDSPEPEEGRRLQV